MEPSTHTESPIHLAEAIAVPSERIIRREFFPPYANPPISNYRKFWYTSASAFWTAFRVQPGDGSTVGQLGTNPVTSPQRAFQEVGFGYTFKAALTTDYWFDVDIDAGPVSSSGSRNTIELELLGANVPPVVVPLTSRFLKTTATLDAQLNAGVQYTLLFKGKVEISLAPGESKYGEIIARFPRLVVNYIRPWGIEPLAAAESEQGDAIDLGHALKALKAGRESGEVLLQPVSFKEIAQAGAQGFGGFKDGQ
jgi:hypothetical protein